MTSTQRIVVTGAASGIGRAVVELAGRRNATVVAVDLPGDALEAVAAGLPPGSTTLAVDLREIDRFGMLCSTAVSTMGGVDALVHAAGVIVRQDLDDVTEADWDLQHEVNLKATFFLCREMARTMRGLGTPGSIVTFTSQGWWTGGFGGSVVYAAAKGGVVSLTRGLARTLAPDDIRVNAVAPGFVETPMMQTGLTAQQRAELTSQVPLGRFARPEEVAAVALFLASPESSYMTGSTLNVSGGQLTY